MRKKAFSAISWIAFSLILILGLFGFLLDRWLFNTWSELSYEEIIFHLKSSIEGTNPDMVIHALLFYVLPGIVVLAFVFVLLFLLRNKKRAKIVIVVSSLLLSFSLLIYTIFDFQKKIELVDHLTEELKEDDVDAESTFIADHYVDPATVKVTFPKHRRNLIYIFLESMETTFADVDNGGAFSENLIPELTELGKEYNNFSGDDKNLNGAVSLPGSTWTMGAMFAQTSGAPLKISMNSNSMAYADSFFPNMITLGDILQQEGYHQVLAVGSDSSFGGRKNYFASHGGYEMHDYDDAKLTGRIPEDYFVWWGFEDEKLFSFAKEDIKNLAAEDEPFNYTMLTVDTHFEDGYQCHLCRDEFGDNVYANSFACSSRQVADFVAWCQKQDFYEDTTIVICGDHPTMDKDFCDDVAQDYLRKTYTVIINGAQDETGKSAHREYSSMDLFPTTLSALGATIEGNRLGLGVNLYSKEPTLIEEYGLAECTKQLSAKSAFLEQNYGQALSERMLETALENSVTTFIFEQRGDNKYHTYVYYAGTDEDTSCWLDLDMVSARIEAYDQSMNRIADAPLNSTDEYGVGHSEIDLDVDNLSNLTFKMLIQLPTSEEYEYNTVHMSERSSIVVLSKNHKHVEYIFRPWNDLNDKIFVSVESVDDEQDTAVWYDGNQQEDGTWLFDADTPKMKSKGVLGINIYGQAAEEEPALMDCINIHMEKFPFMR